MHDTHSLPRALGFWGARLGWSWWIRAATFLFLLLCLYVTKYPQICTTKDILISQQLDLMLIKIRNKRNAPTTQKDGWRECMVVYFKHCLIGATHSKYTLFLNAFFLLWFHTFTPYPHTSFKEDFISQRDKSHRRRSYNYLPTIPLSSLTNELLMEECPVQVLKWGHPLIEIHLILCPKLIFFPVPTSQAKHWFLLGNSNSNLYYWIELWIPVGLIRL